MESFRSLSRIYLKEKPGEPQIIISDLHWREASGASDPHLQSIVERSQESLGSLSQIHVWVNSRASHPYRVPMLKRDQESLRSSFRIGRPSCRIHNEENPGQPQILSRVSIEEQQREAQILISNLYWKGTWWASDPRLGSILKRSKENLRSRSRVYIENKFEGLRSLSKIFREEKPR